MDDEENLNIEGGGGESQNDSSQIPLAQEGEKAKKTVGDLLNYYRKLYGGDTNGAK